VDGAHFTSWWHFNGKTGHKSFPSGQSAIAALILYLPFFIDRKNVKLQKRTTILCAAYVIVIMLTRMRLGAHHLSDVTTGATITLVTIFIITPCFELSLC
jgi:membrane-associated phospholipid phosphatase